MRQYSTGFIVLCPHCWRHYKYYIWSFGSDWYGCKKCRHKLDRDNPLLHIDDEIDKKMEYEEVEKSKEYNEQLSKDGLFPQGRRAR